jgi:hypothetical protein
VLSSLCTAQIVTAAPKVPNLFETSNCNKKGKSKNIKLGKFSQLVQETAEPVFPAHDTSQPGNDKTWLLLKPN